MTVQELAEALEADRIGKHSPPTSRMKDMAELETDAIGNKNWFMQEFETSVKNSFEDEIADVIIRIMDLCGAKGIDIDWHLEQKMKYNALRPHKHGKKY